MDVDRVSYVDNACGWNRYAMKFIGIWPEERRFNVPSSYIVLLPVGFMTLFVSLPQMINLYFIWGDFDLIVENLSVANITVTIAVVKTAFFWTRGKSIRALLSYMEENRMQAETEEEIRGMENVARISKAISKGCTIAALMVVISFFSLRFLLVRYTGRAQFFPAYFPYDAFSSPNYELTVIGQSIAALYSSVSYTTVDTFLAMLILYVCGQLSSLKHQVIDLCSEDRMKFRKKLAKLVKKHNSINRFANVIENRFNKVLLLQMVGCTVQLCVQCFQAILTLTRESQELYVFQMTFMASYIFYVLLQIYLYCYIGERLLTESTDVANAAYDCQWYNIPAREVKYIVLIMDRARSPLRITAGRFCSFNHELFSNILKTSMGYLSVLYNMKSKDVA